MTCDCAERNKQKQVDCDKRYCKYCGSALVLRPTGYFNEHSGAELHEKVCLTPACLCRVHGHSWEMIHGRSVWKRLFSFDANQFCVRCGETRHAVPAVSYY
jgi:hypothetical protein